VTSYDTTPADGCPVRPLTSATCTSDPHDVYRRMREEQGNIARVELEPGVYAWLVMGWDELRIITEHEHLYSHDSRNWTAMRDGTVGPDSGLQPMMMYRDNVIGNDLDKHRRLRRPLDDAVASIDQRRMRRSVAAKCTELIAGFAGDHRADLVADYANVVPLLAIADLFGLDTAGGHELRRALIALFGSQDDSVEGNRNFEQILFDLLTSRRAAPADDLTTLFIDHPDLHDDSEILQAIVVMVSAANETSITWIAQTLRLMLTDDRFGARMRGGRLGIDDALDEVLWADPPMANMPARYALRDTTLGGRYIAKGEALVMGITASNSDPRIHSGDERLEFGNRSHLAWGAGPHACPGRIPARIICRTAVETALHLLRGVRLTIDADDVTFNPSPWTRCPTTLPVTFTPTAIPTPQPVLGRPARLSQPSR